MGEQPSRRAALATWLLHWLYVDLFVGAVGAAIVYEALTHGQVALGGGVTLATVAGMVVGVRARQRETARRRAVAEAWKWWQDPDVVRRQWHLVHQPFVLPYADALPALEQATQETPDDADAWSVSLRR